MEQTDSSQRGGVGGLEEISKRTYMHSPWTQTAIWRRSQGGGRGLGGGGQRGGIADIRDSVSN